MTAGVRLIGRDGQAATVSEFGQLIVAPVDYSTSVNAEMSLVDTAYNMVDPASGQQVVVTDLILTANRLVGVNDATVTIYIADGPETTIEAGDVLELEMVKQSSLAINGLNLKIPKGKWINAKTNDNTVFVTLMFYRVPVK